MIEQPERPRGAPAWWLLAVVGLVALAVVGSAVEIFHGTGQQAEIASEQDRLAAKARAPASPVGHVSPATGYTALRHVRRGPNAAWRSNVGTLVQTPPVPETAESYHRDHPAALAMRGTRRAYDGAPPVIPHPIEDRNVGSCLACHAKGLDIAGTQAPAMSHPTYTSCTQCHAPSVEGVTAGAGLVVENVFVGAQPGGGGGARAWPGAPPTMPHPTWMRETCASCHGPQGLPGLRTTHPERQSCTQCHAPSAALDQRLNGTP